MKLMDIATFTQNRLQLEVYFFKLISDHVYTKRRAAKSTV